jgi:hypothetical protein
LIQVLQESWLSDLRHVNDSLIGDKWSGLQKGLNFLRPKEEDITSLIADCVWVEVKWVGISRNIKTMETSASAATERILSLTNHLKDSLDPADDIQKAKMSTS